MMIEFVDQATQSPGFVRIEDQNGGVALTVSVKENGDADVLLSQADARKVAQEIFATMPKSKRFQPSRDQLKGAVTKVAYELMMLNHTARELRSLVNLSDDDPRCLLRNMALESFLLHARNLHDFFCAGPTPKDDIQASHFLHLAHDWAGPQGLSKLRADQPDINKHLSHLTYARVRERRLWYVNETWMEIRVALWEFLNTLPADGRSLWEEELRKKGCQFMSKDAPIGGHSPTVDGGDHPPVAVRT